MYNLQDRGTSESPKEPSSAVGMTQSDMMVSHGTGSTGGSTAWMNLPPSAEMTQR